MAAVKRLIETVCELHYDKFTIEAIASITGLTEVQVKFIIDRYYEDMYREEA